MRIVQTGRHDTSDYDRMARQRQIQEAILQQSAPVNVLTKFQSIASAGRQVVRTDIPQSALGYFVNLASKTKNLPITPVELVPDNGVNPQDLDIDVVRKLIGDGVVISSPNTLE